MELNGPGGWDDGGGINCRSENRGGELRDHVSVSMDVDCSTCLHFRNEDAMWIAQ